MGFGSLSTVAKSRPLDHPSFARSPAKETTRRHIKEIVDKATGSATVEMDLNPIMDEMNEVNEVSVLRVNKSV